MPKCFQCSILVNSINGMQLHLKHVHNLDNYSAVFKCGEEGCFKTCSSWRQLRRHLKSYHNFLTYDNAVVPDSVPLPEHIPFDCGVAPNNIFNEERDEGNLSDSEVPLGENLLSFETVKEQVESCSSELVTKLYAKPGRPRALVQEFVCDTTEFLSTTLSLVDEIISTKLKSLNIDNSVIQEISETISIMKNPFSDLETEHFRLKYLKDKGFYISPQDFTIDFDMFAKKVEGKMVYELGKVTGKIIPLRIVLKNFLELPNVLSIVLDSLQCRKPCGFVSDFIHGAHWQAKKRHFEGKVVVPLYLYFDDFEVDKDLGPHSAKLGAAYVKIASLPAEFQGSVENIFLALLVSSADCEFGYEVVFRKLVNELNFLQTTGVEVTGCNGQNMRVYFTVGLIVADNLAMHNMLGFAGGFTANYPCRFCRVHRNQMHTQYKLDPTLLRDKPQHEKDIVEANVTTSGVNGPPAFKNLEYFEVLENPSVDLMHDLLEGACYYDMNHILHHLIVVKEYFTTQILNFRIIMFDYGPSFSNKPTQVKDSHVHKKSVNMTANEMKTFVLTFAMLVGDLVDQNDPVWYFYLILRDILDILLCRHIQEEVLVILEDKIAQHHQLYPDLFDDTLKPKHHLMIHYKDLMRLSGCPHNFACDRFEAKHQPFVQDAKGTTSRKNIAHTLAVKEQLRLAYRLMSGKGLQNVLEVGPEERSSFDPFLLPPEFAVNQKIVQYSYVNFKGTIYRNSVCVVVGTDSDGGPEFGIVKAVLLNSNSNVCLKCRLLSNISFSDHFHAYLVSETQNIKYVLISKLLDFHPVFFAKGSDNNMYVTLHHSL